MIRPSQYIETFVKSKNFARPNLFSVEIFPPQKLRIASTELEQICTNIVSSEIPGKSVDAQQNVDGGYIAIQLPFNATYTQHSMVFRCSADLREKRFFEEWQKLIYNETTNTLGWYEDFVGTIEISQLNRNGKVQAKYRLYEVWPGPIGNVQVSHDTTDAISTVDVSFYYRSYIPIK